MNDRSIAKRLVRLLRGKNPLLFATLHAVADGVANATLRQPLANCIGQTAAILLPADQSARFERSFVENVCIDIRGLRVRRFLLAFYRFKVKDGLALSAS